MENENCIFCKIISGDLPSHTVYENGSVVAFLDINPVNPGHTLVVPKAHGENFLEDSQEDIVTVVKIAKKIAPAILKAVDADACNFTTNCGKAAGQVVFHTHFHVIPRFPDDGYKPWRRKEGEADDLEEIAERIKENL